MTKATEQEESVAKHNKIKSQFEYKINFLEEKLKKQSGGGVEQAVKDELEAKVKMLDTNLKKFQAEHTKTMKLCYKF